MISQIGIWTEAFQNLVSLKIWLVCLQVDITTSSHSQKAARGDIFSFLAYILYSMYTYDRVPLHVSQAHALWAVNNWLSGWNKSERFADYT